MWFDTDPKLRSVSGDLPYLLQTANNVCAQQFMKPPNSIIYDIFIYHLGRHPARSVIIVRSSTLHIECLRLEFTPHIPGVNSPHPANQVGARAVLSSFLITFLSLRQVSPPRSRLEELYLPQPYL